MKKDDLKRIANKAEIVKIAALLLIEETIPGAKASLENSMRDHFEELKKLLAQPK